MKIYNKSQDNLISNQATLADTFFSRMIGLLKHTSLPRNEALIITHCNSIHMFFMKFPIDVIFVDKKDKVVGLVERIKPNRLSSTYWKASYAIELAEGVIAEKKVQIGDQLILDKK